VQNRACLDLNYLPGHKHPYQPRREQPTWVPLRVERVRWGGAQTIPGTNEVGLPEKGVTRKGIAKVEKLPVAFRKANALNTFTQGRRRDGWDIRRKSRN